MPENKPAKVRRETLVEKIIRRLLETIGGAVDRIFGRGKKQPDALPSTGDLAERLRRMIDKQAQINKDGRKLAPHLIQLKYAWGQTSDEFLAALKRLKNELYVVAIDHINDNRYVTLAPVKIEAKTDILTEGFTMRIGFDDKTLKEAEQVEVPVEIYAKLLPGHNAAPAPKPLEIEVNTIATFPSGGVRRSVLRFVPGNKEHLTVGRIKENDLYLDDTSVSRHHASLAMTADGKLKVADIGSSNGTSLNGGRIAYGKAYEVSPETTVGFGDVQVRFEWELPKPEPAPEIVESQTLPTLGAEAPSAEPEVVEGMQSGIKIGVKTSKRRNIEQEEPETVFGAEIQDESEEYETVNKKFEQDEPETVSKSKDEPETVVGKKDSESDSAPSINSEPETLFGKTAQSNTAPGTNSEPETMLEASPKDTAIDDELTVFTKKKTEQGAPQDANSDFTQTLETNPLDKDFVDDLEGFDSVLGKPSAGLPQETTKLNAPENEPDNKP